MEEVFTKDHFIEILEALHRDQTGLAAALDDIKKTAQGWMWVVEGARGCYAWDDDEYREEFERCLDAILEKCENAMTRTSQAHQVCCARYGHVHHLPNEITQMPLNFREIMKFATIEGRP